MRSLSGIKPSGTPHIGNYLGAMREHIELQKIAEENFYFIADSHALTTEKNPEKIRANTINIALDYLALGLDPEKTIFFKQSDINEHFELSWILSCLTPFGMMERAHAWKDAQNKKNRDQNIGLFTYPILMAADILIHKPNIVPVGKDQKQHVEIARDLAEKFNTHYGEIFISPKEHTPKNIATIPGTDGNKMSKSNNNTIGIFAEEPELKKQIMSIKTDSLSLKEKKNPKKCIIFELYSHFANEDEKNALSEKYLNGNFGYGEAKQILLKKLLEYFEPYRKKRIELQKNLGYVEDVLKEGKKKAKRTAEETLYSVKKSIGQIS